MTRFLLVSALCIYLSGLSAAQSDAPVIFYSDLQSAPATGGEGGHDGAFVCIYGEHFGSARGSSTISFGGNQASEYKIWADPGQPYKPGHYAKACAQIRSTTPAGATTVQLTSAAGTSNGLPFQVRPGRVYFVAKHGGDITGDGSSGRPWSTIQKCVDRIAPGDICYVEDGVTVTTNDRSRSAINLASSGTGDRPKALVAYPGAKVVIDNRALPGSLRALSNVKPYGEVSYWTIAGMTFDSAYVSVQLFRGEGFRLVDNDILCTGDHCMGYAGGLGVGGPGATTSGISVLGNRIHDIGCHEDTNYETSAHPCFWVPTGKTTISTSGLNWKLSLWPGSFYPGYVISAENELRRVVSCNAGCLSGKLDRPFSHDLPEGTTWKFRFPAPPKFFHNVYFGSTNSVEFGWNEIDGSKGQACRGLLFHSTAGLDEYDLHVHDNDIHDTVCDCLTFATVDPNKGPVEAYNNTFYRCGTGSVLVQQSSFAGVFVANDADCLPNPGRAGKVQFYNNTIYNAGLGGAPGQNNACFALRTSLSPRHGTAGLSLVNNACVQMAVNQQSYLSTYGTEVLSYLSGSNNNCYGAGNGCPKDFSSSLAVAPGFVDADAANFRLTQKSSMRDAGAPTKALFTQDGKKRGDKPNIGAF